MLEAVKYIEKLIHSVISRLQATVQPLPFASNDPSAEHVICAMHYDISDCIWVGNNW